MSVSEGGSDPPSHVDSMDENMGVDNYQNDIVCDLASNEVNKEFNEKQNNDQSKEKAKEKVFPKILYNYRSPGPFEVYVESKDKNIGNYHTIALAKIIYESDFSGLEQINRKGKNRVAVVFSSYLEANKFFEHFSKNPDLNVFIPTHKVTCKGVVRHVDLNLVLDQNLDLIKV